MRVPGSFSSAALFLLIAHLPFFSAPYFWDETGQFVPAALDIFYRGALVPLSTIPNVHPPGVMLWLAAAWHGFGYSIPVTRLAILALAILGAWAVFQLADEFLCRDREASNITLVLLCLSPLFFSQSIMALLDLPAMAFTALTLLLFLRGQIVPAALSAAALVMMKETGALVPAILALVMVREGQWRRSLWFALPLVPLLLWLALLHASTGHWFGNAEFAQYNLTYPLHPVRLAMALLRRAYYLFLGTGYIIGTLLLRRCGRNAFANADPRAWRVVLLLSSAHVIAVCVLGGAVLERYLLPVLPFTLAAFANALRSLNWRPRVIAFAAMALCSLASNFVNPVYPFPLENNLAWVSFVRTQADAASYLSNTLPQGSIIVSTFPFAGNLRRPEFGYLDRAFAIHEIPDLTRESIASLHNHRVDALAVFSPAWDPLGILANPQWSAFVERFYGYRPDLPPGDVPALLRLRRVARFERHGQWIVVFRP